MIDEQSECDIDYNLLLGCYKGLGEHMKHFYQKTLTTCLGMAILAGAGVSHAQTITPVFYQEHAEHEADAQSPSLDVPRGTVRQPTIEPQWHQDALIDTLNGHTAQQYGFDPRILPPTSTDEGTHDGQDTLSNPPVDTGDQQVLGAPSTNPFAAPVPAAFDRSILTSWGQQTASQAPSPYFNGVVRDTDRNLYNKIEQARMEGKPYLIWVNVPSYTLRVFDTQDGSHVLTSRVIVGASGTQTPIFSTDVVNIKFNPDWSPPPSLQRKGKRYTPPGPNNPLGQARFSTNNNMNIYLHDTNNHALFNGSRRALSAGCVRVEQWHSLSQILTGKDAEAIDQYTAGNRIQYVQVPHSLVWISYDRVDLNDNGVLVVHPDVYRRQHIHESMITTSVE